MCRFERSRPLYGDKGLEALAHSRVAIFGIGGVGGHAAEAIARSGIGHIELFDRDVVELTNINRQIVALTSTVGQPKAEVMRRRILDINPDADVISHEIFYLPENADSVNLASFDMVLDCIDTLSAKLELVSRAKAAGTPIISAMGAGNKLDPSRFQVADIYSTSVCPLAKAMRHELRKRGVTDLTVVYSQEEPAVSCRTPASTSFAPGVMGMIMAAEAVKILLQA